MTPEEQIATVKEFLVYVNKMDWESASKYMHEEFFVEHCDEIPYAGRWEGPDGFIALMKQLRETWSSWRDKPYPYDLASVENKVFKEVTFTATLAKTENVVEMPFLEVFEFEGEKILTVRAYYWDPSVIARANIPAYSVIRD